MDIWTVEGRVKSFKQWAWPHLKNLKVYKLVDAEKMAMAGFYCRPLTGSEDNVCCHVCSKNLDGWEPTDEAWREHCAHAPQCPLVTLGTVESRERTFEGRWPHERPNARTMSHAGFFYYPRTGEDDTAYCYQCGLGLDGWEAEDDPWHEHARRRPNCPFIQKRPLMEPAAFQRILGSSSESFIKEVAPNTAPSVQKNSAESATKTVEPVIEKAMQENTKVPVELKTLTEEKENNTSERGKGTNFQKPKKLVRKESIIEVDENEIAIFDSLVADGVVKREELEMSLEDFILKSLVQRELDFYDSHFQNK